MRRSLTCCPITLDVSKTPAKRNVSKLRATPRFVVRLGARSGGIETTSVDIRLNLTVPLI